MPDAMPQHMQLTACVTLSYNLLLLAELLATPLLMGIPPLKTAVAPPKMWVPSLRLWVTSSAGRKEDDVGPFLSFRPPFVRRCTELELLW